MELTKPTLPQDNDLAALKAALTEYNEYFTGAIHREKFSSFVKNDSGVIVGGILAENN